jgi:hypothetical protein
VNCPFYTVILLLTYIFVRTVHFAAEKNAEPVEKKPAAVVPLVAPKPPICAPVLPQFPTIPQDPAATGTMQQMMQQMLMSQMISMMAQQIPPTDTAMSHPQGPPMKTIEEEENSTEE